MFGLKDSTWEGEENVENVSQVGVFALRVVPNGVDATTIEWEGGALLFIGRAEVRFCAEAGRRFTTNLETTEAPCKGGIASEWVQKGKPWRPVYVWVWFGFLFCFCFFMGFIVSF